MPILVYEALKEDLSHLGGPMGTEYTTTESMGIFGSLDRALNTCEKDFGKPIKWRKTHKGQSSPDLGYCMYHVKERKVK